MVNPSRHLSAFARDTGLLFWGLVVGGVFAAAEVWNALVAAGTPLPAFDWSTPPTGLLAGVGVLLMGAACYRAYYVKAEEAERAHSTIEELSAERPRIEVTEGRDQAALQLYLDVENVGGGTGRFEAQITILEGENRIVAGHTYRGWWGEDDGCMRELVPGHHARLVVAEIDQQRGLATLQMLECPTGPAMIRKYRSITHTVGGDHRPRVLARVTVNSAPPMVEPWAGTFEVTLRGLTRLDADGEDGF